MLTSSGRERFASHRFAVLGVAATAAVSVVAVTTPRVASAQVPGAGQRTGESIEVSPAEKVTWAQMLEREARQPAVPAEPRAIPRMPGPAPREIPGGSPGALADLEPAPEGFSPLGPFASLLGFLALEDNNASIPPDTHGAVGPDHLMTMLNTQVRIQEKDGRTISTVSLETFWSSLTGNPFDPKIVYDPLADRWIATVDADSRSATSSVFFAISDTDDPTGAWTFYQVDADGSDLTWADFPGFGVNNTWIAITNNMFSVSDDLFQGVKMWVIEKADALAGGALTTKIFDPGFDEAGGFSSFTMKPALTFDPAQNTLYIVSNPFVTAGGVPVLRLSQITGTGPAPVWSVVAGSTVTGTGGFLVDNDFEFAMIEASQSGTGTTIDSGDPRMTDPVVRNGHLFAVHSAGLPNGGPVDRTAAFWYEIDPTAMPDPIVQSGVLDPGAGGHYMYPSITANSRDDVALGFSRSDSSRFVEAVATGRAASDPAGTMRPLRLIKSGEDSYVKTFGGPSVRWGDYSATVVDPEDDQTFWTIQEYAAQDVGPAASDDRWATFWEKNGAAFEVFLASLLQTAEEGEPTSQNDSK